MTEQNPGMKSKSSEEKSQPLPRFTKFLYGTGDWGLASFGTLRQIFYAIFLVDVVGLDPRLASLAALLGIIWDAINDPLVGNLTDSLRSRWGRRRPFLLIFSIPFGASFLLLWWAPPWQSELGLMVHVTLAFMISDTLQTLVSVPFYALTPELTLDYDERTSLTSYRMLFNLLASLATAVTAPIVVDAALANGMSLRQGYLIVGAAFGGLAGLPFLAMFFFLRERFPEQAQSSRGFFVSIRTAWQNIPFRFATGLYILNWITFDLVALMLPFYLTYWIAEGNLLAKLPVFGEPIALESVIFGLLLITAVAVIPLWNWLARRLGKRLAYILGMTFWAFVQLAIITLQPGQIGLILVLAVLAGISVSTAHVLPDAIFPDVIEWDELRTRQRSEGIYYGAKNFFRKLTGAVAIFVALQVLGWFGYQSPPEGAVQFSQSAETLATIRMLTGPMGAVLLFSSILIAWFYPLNRERHARIRRLLDERRGRGQPQLFSD
ncbi:MAG: MFS transporter [Anaerolineales bacterium]